MFTISDSIHIDAPIERCFLLSTDIELVGRILDMKPIEGKIAGLVVGGDKLLWSGWKFGLPHVHESLITAYERPNHFQDTMRRGRFKTFQHDHYFSQLDGHTVLKDKIQFSMPFSFIGRAIGHALLVPYISHVLRRRLELLKKVAESEEWRNYLPREALPYSSGTKPARVLPEAPFKR